MTKILSIVQIVVITLFSCHLILGCKVKSFGEDGKVCACSADFCDYVGPLEKPENDESFLVYTSNYDGLRLSKTIGKFRKSRNVVQPIGPLNMNNIKIDHTKRYQKIIGFGGAFTDSTGINVNSLGEKVKNHIMRSYFSTEGIEYSLGRIPIAATDFSTQAYSYADDKKDPKLGHFALRKEDKELKIPLIKLAKELSKDLRFFASAWCAPKWMKTNNDYVGGRIKKTMYQAWADYHLLFLEAYKKSGVDISALTTGNEPALAVIPTIKVPSSAWTANDMSKWISENLGPTIRNSNFSHVKIIAFDDQRLLLPIYTKKLFRNNATKHYVDGLAVHWYFDKLVTPNILTATHLLFPDKFILGTEACEGTRLPKGPRLGDWSRGMHYAKYIIQDLQYWVTGWTDWNMALDMTGGPTYIDNFVDSPIIVDHKNEMFYKQPTYYAMGHFSKFIPKDSVRIHSSRHPLLNIVAFQRPDGGISVVIQNEFKSRSVPLVIKQNNRGDITLTVSANSINTIVYW